MRADAAQSWRDICLVTLVLLNSRISFFYFVYVRIYNVISKQVKARTLQNNIGAFYSPFCLPGRDYTAVFCSRLYIILRQKTDKRVHRVDV